MEKGVCALCGMAGEVTREHVPARNLFLKPRPENTLTVPLCPTCNHGYHLDDEYFRVCVAAGAQPGTKLMRLWKEKVVGSSFVRGGGLKGRLHDEYEQVIEYASTHPLELYGGGEVPPEMLPFVQGFDATRINRVVEKIVRCLHYHHTRSLLEGELEIDDAPFPPEVWERSLAGRTGQVGYENEFVYCLEELSPPTWRLIFYEHRAFTVRVH